jgi:hypothetical protein
MPITTDSEISTPDKKPAESAASDKAVPVAAEKAGDQQAKGSPMKSGPGQT